MKCPQCSREYGTRIRIRTQELVCNKCGYVGKLPPPELIAKTKAAINKELDKK